MKANELMIGDWVLFNGNSKKVTSLLVTDLGVDQIYVFGNYCQVATISEYIEPVPLTAEILEKNGFEFDGDEIYKLGDYHLVIEYRGGLFFGWVFCCRKQLNYVHELQHALKLCGIDKNIEL